MDVFNLPRTLTRPSVDIPFGLQPAFQEYTIRQRQLNAQRDSKSRGYAKKIRIETLTGFEKV